MIVTRAHLSLGDYSPEELVFMADEHDDLAFAEMLGSHPAMRKTGDFYEMLTGIRNPMANMMFGLRVPEPERTIAEITDRVRAMGQPTNWWVGPCTKPDGLDEILVPYGWVEEKPAPALAIDLTKLEVPNAPERLRLKEVLSSEDLSEWHSAFSIGYRAPIEMARLVSPKIGGAMRLYTAFIGDEPVGTTGLFITNGVPGIYCVSTFPDFRGRGIGAAVTAQPLLQARDEGYKVGTLQASTLGYPVYKRLGFQDVCELRVFAMND